MREGDCLACVVRFESACERHRSQIDGLRAVWFYVSLYAVVLAMMVRP